MYHRNHCWSFWQTVNSLKIPFQIASCYTGLLSLKLFFSLPKNGNKPWKLWGTKLCEVPCCVKSICGLSAKQLWQDRNFVVQTKILSQPPRHWRASKAIWTKYSVRNAPFNLVRCRNKRQTGVDFAPQLPQHCFWFVIPAWGPKLLTMKDGNTPPQNPIDTTVPVSSKFAVHLSVWLASFEINSELNSKGKKWCWRVLVLHKDHHLATLEIQNTLQIIKNKHPICPINHIPKKLRGYEEKAPNRLQDYQGSQWLNWWLRFFSCFAAQVISKESSMHLQPPWTKIIWPAARNSSEL